MGLFTQLPPKTVSRIWDILFFEGRQVLFRIGLAILALFESQLMGANTNDEVRLILQEGPKKLTDAETLIRCAFDDPVILTL